MPLRYGEMPCESFHIRLVARSRSRDDQAGAELPRMCQGFREEKRASTSLPDYPWQMIGMDLFELNKTQYLLVVDYFSCYPEVIKLTSMTSANVIAALKPATGYRRSLEAIMDPNTPRKSLPRRMDSDTQPVLLDIHRASGKLKDPHCSPKLSSNATPVVRI